MWIELKEEDKQMIVEGLVSYSNIEPNRSDKQKRKTLVNLAMRVHEAKTILIKGGF